MSRRRRGVIGGPGLYIIPRTYLLAVVALLAAGIERLRRQGLDFEAMREDRISNALSAQMEAAKRGGISCNIRWETRPTIHYDPEDPQKTGIVDFKFHWVTYLNSNSEYLGVEAKKNGASGAVTSTDYIDGGVLDFVSGKYGRGHNHGVMMTYVVGSTVVHVTSVIHKAMTRRAGECKQTSAFSPDNSLCSHPHTHRSCHTQDGSGCNITLLHLFFDFTDNTPSQQIA